MRRSSNREERLDNEIDKSFPTISRFVWVRPHLYTGPLDINFSKSDDINPVMAEDPYFNKFKRDYVNIGVGGLIQYDT